MTKVNMDRSIVFCITLLKKLNLLDVICSLTGKYTAVYFTLLPSHGMHLIYKNSSHYVTII